MLNTATTPAQLEGGGIYCAIATATNAGKAVSAAYTLNTTLFDDPLIPTRRKPFV